MKRKARRGSSFRMQRQAMDLPMLVIARDIEDCNEAACRLLGRDRTDIVGRSPLAFSAPTQVDGDSAELGGRQRVDAALNGQPQWFQWRFLVKGGEEVDTLVHLEARRLDDRLRLVAHIQDLSRLLQAETTLVATERRLHQVLDQASAVVFWKGLDGRYLFVNREFCRLVGQWPEAVIGRRDGDVMPAMVATRLRANDARVLSEGRTVTFEEQIVVDGELRTYLVDKFPLFDPDGRAQAVCGIANDITGRKRIEDALQKASLAVSEARGASLFQALTRYLATIVDVDWVFLAVRDSEAATRMHVLALWKNGALAENFDYDLCGTPCETVIGQEFRIYPDRLCERFPDDADFLSQRMQSYAGYPLTDSRGRPLGLIALVSRKPMTDPSFIESVMKIFAARAAAELERDRIERDLRASEASYRAIFEAAEDCIFIHDIETGAFVDVNPRACEVYGYDHATLLTMTPADLGIGVEPYSAREAAQWLARARAGEVVRFEWRRRNSDGSLHWDEVCLKRIRLAGVDRILAVTRDITVRKESAEAIERSENRLRATIEAALDCIITMDDAGRICGFNPAAERCFGYRSEAVMGHSLAATLIPERFRAAHEAGMARFLAHGKGSFIGRRVEVVARRSDGSEFPAELAIAVAEGIAGRIFVGYLRDLTAAKRAEEEREQLEAQLRQAQKMEAIGHLAGGIAHDFNNILTSVTGYLVLAGERQSELGDPRLARYLDQTGVATRRARDLIRQLLTFSRGQRGTHREVSLRSLVEEMARFLKPMLPSTVGFEIDPGHDSAFVVADPVQIEQVVMNLCINARDALDGRGTIRIAIEHPAPSVAVCASCRASVASSGHLALLVGDDGPGIPSNVLERMFEPFFSTKPVGKGSGMGLATVHGIVHEHGGHILIDSKPGGGTAFRVLLPRVTPSGEVCGTGRSSPEESSRRALSGRILVVDDEAMVTGFLEELLQVWGLEVVLAHDGLEGCERFATDPDGFDLVLTDQTMPHRTGLEMAAEIHRANPSVPILLFSGYAEDVPEHVLASAGVRALLAKPVEPENLLALLTELLMPSPA